jgi:hypothetical protein
MMPHTYLEHGLSIFQARLSDPAAPPATHRPAVRAFITLSREACAGATTLGQHLLPLLNQEAAAEGQSWMLLDKELLHHALSQHNLPESLAKFLPEDRVPEIKGLIGELVGLHPPIWQLEQHVAEAIAQIAGLGHVIFVGRAAHLLTRALPGGLHVRLVASMETRIRRLMAQQNCPRAAAVESLEQNDNARRRYVLTNFEQDIDDPHTYDLVINTDQIDPKTAASLVLTALRERRDAV